MNESKQCKYYVKRKHRYCRMTVKNGKNFCGEHELFEEIKEEIKSKNLRICCPLDKKHTCYANKLEKHLKICNAKQTCLEKYIVPGINKQDDICEKAAKNTDERLLSVVPSQNILNVIRKVENVYKRFIEGQINTEIKEHEILKELFKNDQMGTTSRKHLVQTSSLLQHVVFENLIRNNTTFVEFGAGKGKLSYWLAKSLKPDKNCKVMLVDRASHRHKMDNKLKANNESIQNEISRIRADIANLDLKEIDTIQMSEHVVGISKHLCGNATDYTIRCLINLQKSLKNVSGIIIAFCCHHQCLWNDYCGKKFLNENKITSEDFDIICGLVSWATCGYGRSRRKPELNKGNSEDFYKIDNSKRNSSCNEVVNNSETNLESLNGIIHNQETNSKNYTEDLENLNEGNDLGLTRDEKTEIGIKCKLLLNYGRLNSLKENGFDCRLCYYVSKDISLENVCIIAKIN